MTYNDITSSELENLRIALRIENFKSKKQKTITEIIERELALAYEGKSKFISQKHKAPKSVEPVKVENTVQPRLFLASPVGTVVVVETTSDPEPLAYTIVSDRAFIDADNFIISRDSPLGSKLSNAKVQDMIVHGSEFYQVIDILPMVASTTM